MGCKVGQRLPRNAVVARLFDEHGRGRERLERHVNVRQHELRLEIELNEHVLFAVLRLPPFGVILKFGLSTHVNDVFDAVTSRTRLVRFARVAHETRKLAFDLILEKSQPIVAYERVRVADHAEAFRFGHAAR